ncbi:hexose transporter [Dactylonectria macrodidyma]|uniref:Hexose transporter n=1 Tax=Dactylonectria macrodidyma TaxID=307937 RepID=A0A9P9J1A0_9HYPO|nr:hexose transporter [Dactylonectria macrodidyma]
MSSEKKGAGDPTERDHVERIESHDDGNLKHVDAAADAAAKGQAISGYESLTPWETAKKFKRCVAVCFFAAFSAATDGFQIAINASIIANQGFIQEFATKTNDEGERYLESPILSAWGSIMSVGQMLGMATIPFLSTRFGRKAAMYTFWCILALSVLTESLARIWPVWLIGKLLAGIGVGCLQTTLPTYIAEVAPIRIRGSLLMCYSLWWTIGSFMGQVTLNQLAKTHPTKWLVPVYVQWAQIGIMIIIYVFLPESPAWCVTRGHLDRAKKELQNLYGGVEDFNVDQQVEIILLTVEHEKAVAAEQKRENWYSIFIGVDGFRTLVSVWTNLSQMFIGLTLFGSFGTYFFQQAGIPNPFQVKVITSSINIAAVLGAVFLADRFGRRLLACVATTVCLIACVAIGILGVVPRSDASNYIFVVFAVFWNIGLNCNGAAGWGFVGEISSQRLRHYTAGLGSSLICIVAIAMNNLVPYMVNANEWNWGLKTAWFYVGVGFPFTVGMWFLIPETAGRSAAELDELFQRKIKPWRFHKTETATQRLLKEEQEN